MESTISKQAQPAWPAALIPVITKLLKGTTDIPLGALSLAAATGAGIGGASGLAASVIKSNNSKITALNRKKKFYENKIDEMENENWLNDVIDTRKKLETSRLSDEERTILERKYKSLLSK